MPDISISYCPACGQKSLKPFAEKAWQCSACGFTYFHNVAATASAVMTVKNEILLVQRAAEPAQGLYDFPGGFIEKQETAEQALFRELKEELDFSSEATAEYLCTQHNTYRYRNIDYPTLDIFYQIKLETRPALTVADDVAGFIWCDIDAIPDDKLAFPLYKTGN